MKFSATFLTALAILPAFIDAYNPFPVTGHGLDISARTGAGHKMIKRRVVKRGCTVRSASSTIAAVEAFAQQPSTSTPTEETVTSTSAVATPTGGSDSSLPAAVAGPFTGDGTFFAPGLGACGGTNDSSDKIVAVAAELFDQFPYVASKNLNTLTVQGQHWQSKHESHLRAQTSHLL
jgi:hypothetical protein